ncbi:MAG TPA: DUF5615 family PIN-like protein [Tepidisphaeraceae bacterium]|nr:DUF5615 family PIN-like protein [Tepidisphaeraceae bacterium]
MSIALYTDVHVPRPVVSGVRLRGVDVLTAVEDGMGMADDDVLIARATELGRVMVSMDVDMLQHAARMQASGIPFSGLLFARQLGITFRQFVTDLELICLTEAPPYMANRVEYLPL